MKKQKTGSIDSTFFVSFTDRSFNNVKEDLDKTHVFIGKVVEKENKTPIMNKIEKIDTKKEKLYFINCWAVENDD